jgi:hypothetical protein
MTYHRPVPRSARGALLLAATTALTAGVTLLPAIAANAATPTLWVGKAATVNGTGSSCAKPGFNSIESAVSAASTGQTVKICAGSYAEQVTVTKSLTLLGASAGAVHLTPPASPAESTCLPDSTDGTHKYSLLDVCGPTVKVTASGLTLAGPWAPGHACSDAVFGATVTGAATLTLNNSVVTGARLADRTGLGGCQSGIGILAGRPSYSTTGSLVTHNVTVSDYQKGGIVVSGAGSTGQLNATTVDGDPTNLGPDPTIARNGVQFSYGATGTVHGGLIRGNECDAASCGSDIVNETQSGGLLLYGSGKVAVTNAVITENDMGVLSDSVATGTPVSVTSSQIADNRYVGAFVDSGPLTLTSDAITGSSVAGVASVSYDGYGSPIALNVGYSSLSGNGKALWVTSDNAAGDITPAKLAAEHNRITGNTDGVVNDLNTVVDATNSYWGAADGPSVWSFGSGASVSANVNFFPWSKTTALNALVVCGDSTLPGDQIVCGTKGNNVLTSAGTGSTLMLGRGGNDQFRGGAGNDFIIGNAGSDFIDGGAGTNYAQGRGGLDTCQNITVGNRC